MKCVKGLGTNPMFKMKNDGYLSKSCKTCKMTSDIRPKMASDILPIDIFVAKILATKKKPTT